MARDVEAGRAFVRVSIKENLGGLKRVSAKLKSWGASLAGIGARMGAVGAAIGLPFAAAVRTFASFDDGMRQVRGVTQASEADFRKLTTTAKTLGATTSFTAEQVALLMGELGRAGFRPDQINEMTGAVLNLSRATGTEASLAAGIMAASIRQFGMAAGDATRVADALTTAANKSFNSVESLGEALSYAGPVAADFNMSIEDTLAVLGALGNVGIQGSNAGTALRRMLILTGAEAAKMEKIFGGSFRDSAGNALPLVQILEQISAATAGLGAGEKAEKLNEAFGLLGITGASSLARGVGDVRALSDALNESAGAADRTAKEMDAGLGGAFRVLMSAVEGVKIAIGEALTPVLQAVAGYVTTISGVIKEWVENNYALVVAIAGAVSVLLSAAVATIALGGAMSLAGFMAGTLAAVMSGVAAAVGVILSSKLILLAILIAEVSAAFVMWTETGQRAAAFLRDKFAGLLGFVQGVLGGISDALKSGDLTLAAQIAWAGVLVAWEYVKEALLNSWNSLANIWDDFWTHLSTAVDLAITSIRSAWASAVAWIAQKLLKVWVLIEKALAAVGLLNETTDLGGAMRLVQEDAQRGNASLEQARQQRAADRETTLSRRKAARSSGASEGLQAAQEELAGLIAQAAAQKGQAEAEAAQSAEEQPAAPADIKAAVQAAAGVIGATVGTFSAAAAGVSFTRTRDQAGEQTAENTREMLRVLRRIEAEQGEGGAAFA